MIRFGMIGTSEIAEQMAKALTLCPKTVPWGIYSRDRKKGEMFAKKHHIPYPCSTLESLAEVSDAVYIASPNSLHCEQSIYFLERGIPVLCEKPLASNEREVARMIDAAERNGVYLAEAYKTQYLPAYQVIKDHISDLGVLRNVRFDFSKYSSRYDAHLRGEHVNTFKREFSNGALLDLGVYCLYPALDFFGSPQSVCSSGVLLPGGVDGVGVTVMNYPGFLVTLNYSKISTSSRSCEIQGESGTMYIDAISQPRNIEVRKNNGEWNMFSPHTEENDMVYECTAFAEGVENQSPVERKRYLTAFRLLDSIRASVGIVYPSDK